MNGSETIRTAISHAHGWFDGTCADLTSEQASFVPAGTAHPISEIVTHVLQSEDMIVNSMIQGQPSIWESAGWGEKLGLPNVAQHTQEQAKSFTADLQALQPYKEAVYASVQAFAEALTEEELDREIEFGEMKMRVADALTNALLGNTLAHTGEISALKGVQGATGYPF
jgi:uncharacterized damage-inducible protein DinB